eukprot:UN01448
MICKQLSIRTRKLGSENFILVHICKNEAFFSRQLPLQLNLTIKFFLNSPQPSVSIAPERS